MTDHFRVGVVGAGRVGAVLAAALASAGHEVVAAAGESDASHRRIAELLPGTANEKPSAVARSCDLLLLTVPDDMLPKGWAESDAAAAGRAPVVRTTIGRVILNGAFPDDFEFRNHAVLKSDIARLVDETVHRYDRATVEETLDNLKNLGFHYATRAGVTIGVEDVLVPMAKQDILDDHEKKAQKVEGQYRKGIITDDERRQELIEIWTQATHDVAKDM